MPAQPISASRFNLAECILWDDALRVLWWTDIHASRLWRYDPATRQEHSWALPERLGCFALTHAAGVLLLGLEQGLARFDTASGRLSWLAPVAANQPQHRINDGRCDRAGNFVFGTLNEGGPAPTGGFYRYTAAGVLQRLSLPGVSIANSICFSPDGQTLYFCDSPRKQIMACRYDPASGATGNLRVFVDLTHAGADPDGAIVDADGGVWSAQWGGARVVRYTPLGQVDRTVPLTADQITCLALGGDGFDQLFITSAAAGLDDAARAAKPDSGAIFQAAAPGVRGLPESRFG
ncbi:SMP-30/gluconolactonase/LRE family protein [Chitiniphilus purpureus]|uniref:SMP-30/gluconolactonase/LRE family protein n=1 Tax=Chitiniphilus purpureus TaxID=2981137 RepID=A0ABY6DJA7_9NEIS|nr:SMP-30/gluconolactonase/LRE family protein [Chitiniphilus sp. CD1]UXY14437.1 SMP-30/gluconolactonase/LRE family protein [Chitiniphilus sp. CD1]